MIINEARLQSPECSSNASWKPTVCIALSVRRSGFWEDGEAGVEGGRKERTQEREGGWGGRKRRRTEKRRKGGEEMKIAVSQR